MPDSFNEFQQSVIEEFRANGGKVGGPFDGADLLLLTTTGAKSGSEHTTPLGFVREGGRLLVVGSAGGSDRHPAWYHNLLAHPMVRVEIGTETFGAVAVPAQGEERDRLFAHVVREAPGYAGYQEQTTRVIPVVVLDRSQPDEALGAAADMGDMLVRVHTWLRGQLDRVRVEADAYFLARAAHQGPGDPPPPGLGLQLRQHCLAFCESLEFHHTGEDTHLFPGLEEHHPHLRDTVARLREEHRTVERIQRELVELLGAIDTADPQRFRAELELMSAELRAHLDYEEESLIPVLAGIPMPSQPPAPAAADGPDA
ncbi:nitroreductase/quinone reductase family protein [Nocardiopsis sediminis]|uniref:Nitroreductase/quinone reductase family protein n=1 Tax=Nocardiopsis sediminis TaxID=1778267 RepID=A0ABV8FPW5_9ACTN